MKKSVSGIPAKRTKTRLYPLLWVLAVILCLPATAGAAEILVTTDNNAPAVYGNSTGGDGLDMDGNPTDNTLTVEASVREAYGGRSDPTKGFFGATNNKVKLMTNGVARAIYGGVAIARSTNTVTSEDNIAYIDGGHVLGNAHGGAVSFFSTASNSIGTVKNNEVTVVSGTVDGYVAGGFGIIDTYATGTITASTNSVALWGGTVSGNVYGSLLQDLSGDSSNTFVSDYNSVRIVQNPDLAAAELYGSAIMDSSGNLEYASLGSTSNVLAVSTSGITVKGIYNFQSLLFYVPSTLAADGTMLTVTDKADIKNANISVGMSGKDSPLIVGDSVKLIDASAGTLDAADITWSGAMGANGVTKAYIFEVAVDGNILEATVVKIIEPGSGGGDDGGNPTGKHLRAQLKSLAETRVSGIGMLTMGGDMVAGQALSQLRATPALSGLVPFGVMGGSSMRYKSGSHVDVDGFNLVTGLGWNAPLGSGSNVLAGVFFEAGWGDYDADNSFRSTDVKGKGNTNYYGGGVLARYDAPATVPGNIYTEASFRVGRVKTDYDSADFISASGGKVSFDSSATYYGAHAGLGYVWNISDATSLDMYTKYLWTRQGSDSVKIQGDSIKFKTMNSQRARVGAKLAHTMKNTKNDIVFTPYVGAAFEREFDGKARGTAAGKAIESPSVRGNTGIGELGFSFKPSATSAFSVDLGMQGYTGKREGLGGSVQVKWEF